MEKFDISKLREETLKAIEKGEELKRLKEIEESEKESLRKQEARMWAEQQCLSVPTLAMEAARKGKNRFTVVNTNGHYDVVRESYNKFSSWKTDGIGLRYFYLEELLEEGGFEVKVTYQHDGVGIESWYNVDVIW